MNLMFILVETLFYFALAIQAGPGRVVELVLPRGLGANEGVVLEVKLGAIASGAEIEIETKTGRTLGVISPHGIRAGNEAGTYVVPVPPEVIANNRLSVRLIHSFQSRRRAPTNKEVKDIRLKITPR